jgi:hypothetical protein
LQFGLRELFIATTITALVLAASRFLEPSLASSFVIAMVVALIAWSFTCDGQIRGRIGAFLAAMFFPFVWIIAFNVPIGHTSGLIEVLPLGPGIIVAELIRALGSFDRDHAAKLAIVFVFVQLLLGVELVRLRGKLPVIYVLIILVTSSMSSFFLHALYRM